MFKTGSADPNLASKKWTGSARLLLSMKGGPAPPHHTQQKGDMVRRIVLKERGRGSRGVRQRVENYYISKGQEQWHWN